MQATPWRSRAFRHALVIALAALTTVLAGCATPGATLNAKSEDAPAPLLRDRYVDPATEGQSEDLLGVGATPEEEPQVQEPATVRGNGKLVNAEVAPPRGGMADDGEATFNFEGTALPAVVKTILGDVLQENYIIAPGVGGTVTFATAKPVKREQALSILEMLLAWNNATIVYGDGRYTVVPLQGAVQGNLAPRFDAPNLARGYEVRVVPLHFVAATEMEKILQPYVRQGSILRADNARSMIVIAGTKRELQNYVATIDTFDVDWMRGMSFGMFTLESVEVKTLVPELEGVFGEQSQSPLAGLVRFIPIERINAVMVITPQASYLDEVERWIHRLDQGGSEAGARLYVYNVRNIKALDLSDKLNEIFTGAAPAQRTQEAGNLAPGLQPVELSSSSGRPIGKNQPVTQPTQIQNTTTPATGPNTEGGVAGLPDAEEINISAFEDNNQLIVRATPQQYDVIRAAIKRLDVEPLQVHIEAKIVKVSLTNNLSYGVQWYIENFIPQFTLPGVPTDTGTGTSTTTTTGTPSGSGTTTDTSGFVARRVRDSGVTTLGGRVNGGEGVTYVFAGRQFRALVNLLESEGDVTFVGAPSLLVLNNKEASINVGTQIPVNSSFIASPITGGTGGSQTLVQFRDTGVTLTVTPRVNPGGLVIMEISQEQSVPVDSEVSAGGNVAVDQQTIQTEVAVQSGDTVLLGGLISAQQTVGSKGIPILHKIPIVGGLFGARRKDESRTETLVLITPTVIEGADGAAEMTDDFIRGFKSLEPLQRELNFRAQQAERAVSVPLNSRPADDPEPLPEAETEGLE